jgi:hypothetical protein
VTQIEQRASLHFRLLQLSRTSQQSASKMNASRLNLLICLVHLCESAAIYKKNDTLEVLKKDVASVGGAIENFTFDLLREVFEDSEETTTVGNRRKARSTEDDVRELCRKRCQEEEAAETQQIKELKREVKKTPRGCGDAAGPAEDNRHFRPSE